MRAMMRIRKSPEDPSCSRIERNHVILRLNRIHDAVHHQRRRLKLFERTRLEHPLQFQVLDVGSRDLGERTIALSQHISGVRQPVLRFAIGVEKAVKRHLRLK